MQLDVLTLFGITTLALLGFLVYRVQQKAKTDLGTAVHLLILAEWQLLLLALMVIFSAGGALFAASIHPEGETIRVNALSRYIVHGGIEFTSAITLIFALDLFARSLKGIPKESPFTEVFSKYKKDLKGEKNRYKKALNRALPLKIFYWVVYYTVLLTLLAIGVSLTYYNTYLIAGGLGEIKLFTDYISAILAGDWRLANRIFALMTYPMQASSVAFIAHLLVVILDGVTLSFRRYFLGIGRNAEPATEKAKEGKEESKGEEKGETNFKAHLKYVLNFVGPRAARKLDDIDKAYKAEGPSENSFKIAATIRELHRKVENYLKNEKSSDKDNKKKKEIIDEIVSGLQKSPEEGGVGLTIPKA